MFDVIIIGGSFAGLSAALALGRARRSVLVVDADQPCNRMVEVAHNLITHDGESPRQLREKAREELACYGSVHTVFASVSSVSGREGDFTVNADGHTWHARRLLLSTGVQDLPPPVPGLVECWGRSVLHCPFCHGYEVRDTPLGVLAEGSDGYEFARLIHNWSEHLTLFTNGPSVLSGSQRAELTDHGVVINEEHITRLLHVDGQLTQIHLEGGGQVAVNALFTRMPFRIPEELIAPLGCAIAESGHVLVDDLKRTSVPGIYAAGDLTSPMRSLAAATAAGNMAGASITHSFVSQWQ